MQQQLFEGFGLWPTLRYLRIARNNQKISDAAFKLQVITTVTQITNMYWDLVSAYESGLDPENRRISRKTANKALLPPVALTGFYAGTGLAGLDNPAANTISTAPRSFAGALTNAFHSSSPDDYAGVSVDIRLRNCVAKSDQYPSELEYRQAGLSLQQLKKQIRTEVRNAQYALAQSEARVEAARKARDLAQKGFDISKKEQELGAGSNLQTS